MKGMVERGRFVKPTPRPRRQDIIREVLDWLDRQLGPVMPAD